MFNDDSSKIEQVETVINVLSNALVKLREHDYPSAQVMVAISRQTLEELQLDFDLHFQAEMALEQLFQRSLN
ncbi:hypothetical protein [Egbenema bharatensis]|uniref:hypothetical protein n=1 Tax=Egbenema bharatensis TaxID=3463334 RepID=UPI003A8A0DE9